MKVADATPDKADILAVVRPLCRFAGRLNDYARRTQRVSPTAQKVREYLQTATRPDKLVFEDLPHACGLGPIAPRGHLSEDVLSQYITTLRGALGELHRCYDELLADLTKSIGKAFQIEGDRSEIRQRIADRAEAIRDWVADPGLKSFILRASDPHLDDLRWLESIVALLSQKPPSDWRNEDHARFQVALVNSARLFSHVEGLAFGLPGETDDGEEEPIRIGITTRTCPELERVIRIPARQRQEVVRLQGVVRTALNEAGVNGNGHVAAAALAKLVQEFLEH